MRGYYLLNDDRTTREVDMNEWTFGAHLGTDSHCVGDDEIGEWRVSTVFIGIDMTASFLPADTPPRIFETMLFGPDDLQVIGRPSTWAEAEALHVATVAALRATFEGK